MLRKYNSSSDYLNFSEFCNFVAAVIQEKAIKQIGVGDDNSANTGLKALIFFFSISIMSTITDIMDEPTFHSHVSSLPSTALAVISFHTPWAAPCKQMHLILETLASSYPPQSPPVISFFSLDAEALPEISESYDVTAVPFLVLQRDGKVLESVSGSEASKVRDAVERHAGKGGNTGKLGLPPALDTIPVENGEDKAAQTEKTKNLSSYAPDTGDAATAPEMSSTQGQKEDLDQRLEELVKAAPVMLFMKGTPSTPQCGFSRQLVGLLREKGVRYGFFK